MQSTVNLFAFLFLTQCFCSFFLTGLIWTIQLVHYPSFLWVEKTRFVGFSQFHGFRISLIVIPLMCLELLTALYLYWTQIQSDHQVYFLMNLIFVVLIWGSTFFLSVPYHTSFNEGFSASNINNLVLTNWPRTLLWSLKSLGLFVLMLKTLKVDVL